MRRALLLRVGEVARGERFGRPADSRERFLLARRRQVGDAQQVLRELESEMEKAVGRENLEALRLGLRNFLGGVETPSGRRMEIA